MQEKPLQKNKSAPISSNWKLTFKKKILYKSTFAKKISNFSTQFFSK
jgi:hypothetical protein